MGLFDSLIDKDTVEPKKDMEYIYMMDMVWTPNKLGSKYIKEGTIVTNVTKMENGSFQFTNKENGEVLRTNYGWSLAENTTENQLSIDEYENEYILFKEYEKKVDSLRNKIKTLKNGI